VTKYLIYILSQVWTLLGTDFSGVLRCTCNVFCAVRYFWSAHGVYGDIPNFQLWENFV